MIKAICFDLDGVFFTEASFKTFCEKLAINTEFDKAYEVLKKSDAMSEFKIGKMTEEQFWNYARSYLNLNFSNEEIFTILRDSYEIDNEVLEVIKKIRENGYKTCICSNNFETRIRELDRKFNFLSYFDVPILSYKVGYAKPTKEIFQELINQSQCKPEEIVYSDDFEPAVNMAKEMGINAFVFEGFDPFIIKLKELGVVI